MGLPAARPRSNKGMENQPNFQYQHFVDTYIHPAPLHIGRVRGHAAECWVPVPHLCARGRLRLRLGILEIHGTSRGCIEMDRRQGKPAWPTSTLCERGPEDIRTIRRAAHDQHGCLMTGHCSHFLDEEAKCYPLDTSNIDMTNPNESEWPCALGKDFRGS